MRTRYFHILLAILTAVSPAIAQRKKAPPAAKVAEPQRGRLDGLDDFISGAMKDWKVPGLAITVVQDGKVVLLKGYGYRDV